MVQKLLLFSFVLVILSGCKVLFWKDTKSYDGGVWLDKDSFVEVVLEYESKLPMNPLSQNILSRDYRTVLMAHTLEGDSIKESVPIASYKGWSLGNTLYPLGKNFIIVRGTSDDYGSQDREVVRIEVSEKYSGAEPKILLARNAIGGDRLVGAIPSPDQSQIAVFHVSPQHEKEGKMSVDFYSLESMKNPKRFTFDYYASPSLPVFSWGKKSEGLYIQMQESVKFISAESPSLQRPKSFPQCFYPTKLFQAPGKRFVRNPPDMSPSILSEDSKPEFDSVPYISDFKKIGYGCP